MIGLPVTSTIDNAAPPLASPSNLVRTTASKPTPDKNALAVTTASCPIMASTTKKVSSGFTAFLTSLICCINCSSTPVLPAVSIMTKLCNLSFAYFTDCLATSTASPVPFPGSGAKTGTFIESPTTCN